jgi:uncharacterized membrane protein
MKHQKPQTEQGLANQSENSDLQVQLRSLLTRQEFFLGPLPPPSDLKLYGEISPDYPERLMKMAEAHSAADVHLKYKESASIGHGQIFSFVLGLTGFCISAIFALKGMEGGAIAAAIGGVAPIIVAALGNLQK